MKPILEIFSQGDEIMTGQIADTNAAWLARQAIALGFEVTRHTAVGDRLTLLIGLLREIAARADCCLCTGGLGPTSDDYTAEAVALAFGRPLQFDAAAFGQIERFYRRRQRPMPAVNRKQALLPEGCERIDNFCGTAPGFTLQQDRCRFFFMPGVPSEMKTMFREAVQALLTRQFRLEPGLQIVLRTFGLGESDIQQRLEDIALPDSVRLGFRADIDEVQVKLLFPSDFPVLPRNSLIDRLRRCLGGHIFAVEGLSEPGGSLTAVLGRLMTTRGRTLTVIETASQGAIAARCLGAPWLLESRYYSSLEALAESLEVSLAYRDLSKTAEHLAKAAHRAGPADLLLLQISPQPGSDAALPEQPVDVYTVLCGSGHCSGVYHRLLGTAIHKQTRAALLALDFLRHYLQKRDLEFDEE